MKHKLTIYRNDVVVDTVEVDEDNQILYDGSTIDDGIIEALNDALDEEPQDERYTGEGSIIGPDGSEYSWISQ
jgi:cytosine/adenosine deaminase-related metal-dependent hydrolase